MSRVQEFQHQKKDGMLGGKKGLKETEWLGKQYQKKPTSKKKGWLALEWWELKSIKGESILQKEKQGETLFGEKKLHGIWLKEPWTCKGKRGATMWESNEKRVTPSLGVQEDS